MAIRRPQAKKLSVEAANLVTMSSAMQDTSRSRQASYDPQKYPVFEVPVNEKVLVYVPNHTVQMPDGSVGLRMDRFAAHPVIEGRSFSDIRCINGLVNDDPQLNWDGTCPLCDGLTEVWELYNKEYADIARSRGMATDSPEAQEGLKESRIELLKGRVIKEPEAWMTFPIVVINCEEKDGVRTVIPKINANGGLDGTVMWYTIRERTFKEKWEAGYDSLDGDIPSSPAGLWAVLNFTYQPKNGKADKMGSARALKVTYKPMEGYQEWAKYFDNMTQEWTPSVAQEYVVKDVIRSKEETQEVADTVLKPVRDKLALYSLGQSPALPGATNTQTDADNALASLGAVPVTPAAPAMPTGMPVTAEMPNIGVN